MEPSPPRPAARPAPAGRRPPRAQIGQRDVDALERRRGPGTAQRGLRADPGRLPAQHLVTEQPVDRRRARRRRPRARRGGRAAAPADRGPRGRAAGRPAPERTGMVTARTVRGRVRRAPPVAPRLRCPSAMPAARRQIPAVARAAPRPARAERVERRGPACRADAPHVPLTGLGARRRRRPQRPSSPNCVPGALVAATCSAPCRPPSTAPGAPACR